MADQGAFGKLYVVKQSERHFGPYSPGFWDVESSGGVLMDMGCHGIAFCCWFLGSPKIRSVYCHMATYVYGDKTRGEDDSICILEFDNGAVGLVKDSWAHRGGMEDRIEVCGEGRRRRPTKPSLSLIQNDVQKLRSGIVYSLSPADRMKSVDTRFRVHKNVNSFEVKQGKRGLIRDKKLLT